MHIKREYSALNVHGAHVTLDIGTVGHEVTYYISVTGTHIEPLDTGDYVEAVETFLNLLKT